MVDQVIVAKTPEMILLQGGKPKTIGGIYLNMDLEFENGIMIKANCVFFNLDPSIASTDFFLFNSDNDKLISYAIGSETNLFYRNIYLNILSVPQNHLLTNFINEFVSDYVAEGLSGNFPQSRTLK
jgi:hypothetical protein